MNRQLVERALAAYDVDWVQIDDEKSGYRNKSYRVIDASERELNLIFYKSEPGILERIKRADAVSEKVADCDLPTRRRFIKKTLCMTSSSGQKHYARLYEYLPGATIPWESYTKKHIKLLGMAMSDFHFVASDIDIELPDASAAGKSLTKSMNNYFCDENVAEALKEKLNLTINPSVFSLFTRTFQKCEKLPNKIPIHLDLVRGNVLFGTTDSPWKIKDLSLTGLIDFEKVSRGNAVFDIARTYGFLLIDCHKTPPDKLYKYLITSGYNKGGQNQIKLNGELSKIFHQIVRFYLFYDFYKFLLHNPYEFLPENHHFVLTRDILAAKNMLKYTK